MNAEVTFASWLKQRRREAGIAQEQLAEKISCSLSALEKIESGRRRPSRQLAELLADFFHVPPDEREAFITFAHIGHSSTSTPISAEGAEVTMGSIGSASMVNQATPWRRVYLHQTNLPAMLTPLIGRDQEVEAARDIILNPKTRLLTLTGAPGIGKTRLALEVGWKVVEEFEHGVYFVDLSPVVDPAMVLVTVAYTLGLKEGNTRSLDSALLEFVRERKMLLVLDNFEQVLDAAPEIVRLLQASPWLKTMATSREPLHVRGERRYVVPPLESPELMELLSLATLADYPSVQLLVDRAQAVDADFELDATNAQAVAQICRRLGGLPLAIELIAARITLLSPTMILAQLEQVGELSLLIGGARDRPTRHKTLRAAIAWSYDLLDQQEQSLFRRLAVFVGSFNSEAVAEVVNNSFSTTSVHSEPTLRMLLSLAEKNLIKGERQSNKGSKDSIHRLAKGDQVRELRFGMLETIHKYALEKLEENGEDDEARERHANYFLRLAEGLPHPPTKAAADMLEEEHDNLRSALIWVRDRHDWQAAVRLVSALWEFWFERGYWSEGRKWIATALALPGAGEPTQARGEALTGGGFLARSQDDLGTAWYLLEEAAHIYRSTGDKGGLANVLRMLGQVARDRGDYAQALPLFERSLSLFREVEDKVGEAVALRLLAQLAVHRDDYESSETLAEQALDAASRAGEAGGTEVSLALRALGLVASGRGDYVKALGLFQQAIAYYEQIGSISGLNEILPSLGLARLRSGDVAGAHATFTDGLELSRKLGDMWDVAQNLGGLGGVAAAVGEPCRAARLLAVEAAWFERSGLNWKPEMRAEHDKSVAASRAQLDEQSWTAEWAEGREMSMEEAVKYALEKVPAATRVIPTTYLR